MVWHSRGDDNQLAVVLKLAVVGRRRSGVPLAINERSNIIKEKSLGENSLIGSNSSGKMLPDCLLDDDKMNTSDGLTGD